MSRGLLVASVFAAAVLTLAGCSAEDGAAAATTATADTGDTGDISSTPVLRTAEEVCTEIADGWLQEYTDTMSLAIETQDPTVATMLLDLADRAEVYAAQTNDLVLADSFGSAAAELTGAAQTLDLGEIGDLQQPGMEIGARCIEVLPS